MTDRDAARDQLTAALIKLWEDDDGESLDGVLAADVVDGYDVVDAYLAALLPVVDRIANERAAAALEAAADWLEGDPDKGGAPLITGNFSVLFADRLDIAQAVSWAGASLRDRAAALTAGSEAGT